jgi:hypothetical protein
MLNPGCGPKVDVVIVTKPEDRDELGEGVGRLGCLES